MIATLTLLALLNAPAPAGAAAAAPPPVTAPAAEVSRYSVNMYYVFSNIPKALTDLKVWFPIPADDDQQTLHNRVYSTPYNIETAALSDTGTMMGHMVGGARGGLPMQVRVSFDLERHLDRRGAGAPAASPFSPEMFRALSQRWLKAETLSAPDNRVKEQARKASSGRKSPIEKARGIFDYVVSRMTLLGHARELQGAGYGRVAFTVKEMKGDRTDLASAFVGLCRAAGIPARTVIGLRFPKDVESGTVRDWHVWAEILTEEAGWIPADPVAAIQDPSRKSLYFGSLDPDRLAVSIGRDIILIPPQTGAPLNFFVNPYWEGNGREMPPPLVEIEFKRIDKIQPGFGAPVPVAPAPASPGGQ